MQGRKRRVLTQNREVLRYNALMRFRFLHYNQNFRNIHSQQ